MLRTSPLSLATCLLLIHAWCIDSAAQETDIKLGKETTFITEPLADDGLPNYALAILEQQRKGVTPENNGAIPFWRAMGPCDDTSKAEFELMAREIELEDIDFESCLFRIGDETIVEYLIEWITTQDESSGNDVNQEKAEEAAYAILDYVQTWPWDSRKCPPMAQWLKHNQQALALLHKASEGKSFYSPSISILQNPEVECIDITLEYAQAMRYAARGLNVRSLSFISQGKLELAWKDIRALLRLSKHTLQGTNHIEIAVGMALRGMAFRNVLLLLDHPKLDLELASEIAIELHNSTQRISIAETLNSGERFLYLDAALRFATGRLGGRSDFGEDAGKAARKTLDSNLILKLGNEWYDRIVRIAELKKLEERRLAISEMESDIRAFESNRSLKYVLASFSKKVRSRKFGEIVVALTLPPIEFLLSAVDRDESSLDLTQIAVELALYRLENDSYPEQLAELKPRFLSTIPADACSEKAFRYERRNEGYLLYGLGIHGKDDHGTSNTGPFRFDPHSAVKGEWGILQDDVEPTEYDDLIIRMPLPEVDWPQPQ